LIVKIKKKTWLDLNHLFSWSKTKLRSLCICILLRLVSKILVSSANKIGRALRSTALGKSLMYTRNNNGPKIELCGTPYFIILWLLCIMCSKKKAMIYSHPGNHCTLCMWNTCYNTKGCVCLDKPFPHDMPHKLWTLYESENLCNTLGE